jgi:hypothetical protein
MDIALEVNAQLSTSFNDKDIVCLAWNLADHLGTQSGNFSLIILYVLKEKTL